MGKEQCEGLVELVCRKERDDFHYCTRNFIDLADM